MTFASVAQLAEHRASNADVAGSFPVTCSICKAPQWLVDRMEALKKLPPPTLEEVETQFRASADFRAEWSKLDEQIERGIPIQ